jgi:peptidyl-prolyl cis-trans isomerase
MIRLTTNFGTIDIELDYKNAPVTASNFEQYVKDGHYNGLIFHRVIPGFMIQGGGFKPGMDEVDTREPIKNEANNGLSNEKYTIAMARTNDPHSASAQFFINVADNKFLDFKSETMQGWGYAVFGKVLPVRMLLTRSLKSAPVESVGMTMSRPKMSLSKKLRLSKCHSTALFLLRAVSPKFLLCKIPSLSPICI